MIVLDYILTILVIIELIIFAISNIILLPLAYIIRIKNKKLSETFAYHVITYMFYLIRYTLLINVKVEYEEKIDPNQKYMFISNHRGNFDVILTYPLLPAGTFIVAKNSLKKLPIVRQWMELINCYFLDRDNIRDGFNMVINSIDKINNGASILIYPEGTRSRGDDPRDMLDFKDGVFKIAEKCDIEILPISISDSSNIYEKKNRIKSLQKVNIKIHKAEKLERISDPSRYFKEKIKEGIVYG